MSHIKCPSCSKLNNSSRAACHGCGTALKTDTPSTKTIVSSELEAKIRKFFGYPIVQISLASIVMVTLVYQNQIASMRAANRAAEQAAQKERADLEAAKPALCAALRRNGVLDPDSGQHRLKADCQGY